MFTHHPWKDVLISLALFIWVTLAPIEPAILCVVVLPLLDLILALISAKKKGQPWVSRGWQRLITKVFIYEAATVLAFVVETWLVGPIIPLVKGITGLIGMTELKSCLEHLDDINGAPVFGSLLNKITPPVNNDKQE